MCEESLRSGGGGKTDGEREREMWPTKMPREGGAERSEERDIFREGESLSLRAGRHDSSSAS